MGDIILDFWHEWDKPDCKLNMDIMKFGHFELSFSVGYVDKGSHQSLLGNISLYRDFTWESHFSQVWSRHQTWGIHLHFGGSVWPGISCKIVIAKEHACKFWASVKTQAHTKWKNWLAIILTIATKISKSLFLQ